jgi:hypothetical protein
VYRDVHGVCHF